MPPDEHTRTSPPPEADATRSQAEPTTATRDAAAAIRDLLTDIGETAGTPSARPPAPDSPPGFVIERELGVGGMGVVYLARQTGLNRPVALKVVKGGTAVDAKAVIRFLAEAEAVAAIRHPNVVEVYQYGDHTGKPYMALEFCPGGDLRALSKGGQTRDAGWFRRVAELMSQVADGVNAAHAIGIVHRDLKPHNVFLTADGTPKVADFGLAKRGLGSDLTHTGAVMGTPAYMSPEQAGGGTKFVGPEADVWALGVILYELACGERPVRIDPASPLPEALARVAAADVPPLRVRCPAVPKDLAVITHKCLRRDPRDRYRSAAELAADLRNWLGGKPISARPANRIGTAVKWARRNPVVAVSLAVATVALVTGTGVSLWQANEARQRADELADRLRESRRVLDLARLRDAQGAYERGQAVLARSRLDEVDPDNRCFVWRHLARRCEGGLFDLIAHTDSVNSVGWSADGRRILTHSSDDTVRVWDAHSGTPLAVLRDLGEYSSTASLSPDGRRVVAGSFGGTAAVWDVATGEKALELPRREAGVHVADWSPDGGRVATGAGDGVVRVWDAGTGRELRGLRVHTRSVSGLRWSPDGRHLVTGSADKSVKVWDTLTGAAAVQVAAHQGEVRAVAFSPDGRRVVSGASDGLVQVCDVATGKVVLERQAHPGRISGVHWSPDGRRFATASYDHFKAEDNCARVWDAANGEQVLVLAGHRRGVGAVAFSPDGRRVVTGSGDHLAKVWDADSAAPSLAVRGSPAAVRQLAFSPDGRRVLAGSDDGTARVWDAVAGSLVVERRGHAGPLTGWPGTGTRRP